MSVKVWERYQPNAQFPTPQYPYGFLKNESALGIGDGTPLDVDWGNDFEAFKQTAFQRSGLEPSGVTDTVTNSEMFNAMQDATLRNVWKRLSAESGYTLVDGSFEDGATLTLSTQCVWYKTENKIYIWKGIIPVGGKVVPPDSTPDLTGGVNSLSGWYNVSVLTLRGDLLMANGSENVTFSVLEKFIRTAKSKMADEINLIDYGAVGDGTVHPLSEVFTTLVEAQSVYPFVSSLSQTRDWAALQLVVNTKKSIRLSGERLYLVPEATVTIPSGLFADAVYFDANKCTFVQTVAQTPIFDASNTDGCEFTRGNYKSVGGWSYVNSPSSQDIAIKANGASNIAVHRNSFDGFYYSPFMVGLAGVNIKYHHNTVTGPKSTLVADANRRNTTGFTILGSNVMVHHNIIKEVASGGIIGQESSDVLIDQNIIHDLVNEHGLYVDASVRRVSIFGNVISSVGAAGVGIKVQHYEGTPWDTTDTVNISGNTIDGTGAQGILVVNTTSLPSQLQKLKNINITGNSVTNSGAAAVSVRNARGVSISSNDLVKANGDGIEYADISGTINGNFVNESKLTGLRCIGNSLDVDIKRNEFTDCASGAISGSEYEMYIGANHTSLNIKNNKLTNTKSGIAYSIFTIGVDNSTLSLCDNDISGTQLTGIRLANQSPLKEYKGNNVNVAGNPTYQEPLCQTIVSSGTLSVPSKATSIVVSGTTSISTIPVNGHSGKVLTLLFTGNTTVIRGSGNLILNVSSGNFVTTAGATLVLMCTGSEWYEVSRCKNS